MVHTRLDLQWLRPHPPVRLLSARHACPSFDAAPSDVASHFVCAQFEAWLAMQKPTAAGLVSAPWDEKRCTIRCLYNAPAAMAQQLVDMWGAMTAEGAYTILSQPDVVVTNQSDKDAQLPKIRKLDQQVRDCMADSFAC